MSQETFSIPNISCGHCTSAIENELGEVDGITSVKGNIEGKSVTVEWGEPATREGILAKLKEINYPATE
ncbi:MAG: heavy-metal-associated domain-containing protein [Desulfobacterales bacterium]|nr:heavy-metal-associated domain-containing protein [Desulfobacterales bacterium]